jgi:hypothetical protein
MQLLFATVNNSTSRMLEIIAVFSRTTVHVHPESVEKLDENQNLYKGPPLQRAGVAQAF